LLVLALVAHRDHRCRRHQKLFERGASGASRCPGVTFGMRQSLCTPTVDVNLTSLELPYKPRDTYPARTDRRAWRSRPSDVRKEPPEGKPGVACVGSPAFPPVGRKAPNDTTDGNNTNNPTTNRTLKTLPRRLRRQKDRNPNASPDHRGPLHSFSRAGISRKCILTPPHERARKGHMFRQDVDKWCTITLGY